MGSLQTIFFLFLYALRIVEPHVIGDGVALFVLDCGNGRDGQALLYLPRECVGR